jgi:Ca-activated chloride channel family protein
MLNANKNLAQATSTNDLMMKSVTVDGDVYGGVFEAKVQQQFTNPTAESVEVVYTFPLPIDATLLRVDVLMGEKRLSGKIVTKPEANVTYEETLSEGDAAILLERADDGNYVISLSNLAPAEDCCVEISYAHMLAFEQDSLRIRIPTVIAPRYGDPHDDGGLSPHQVPTTDVLAQYEFALELRLHGELSSSRVASPSHPISIAPAGHTRPNVTKINLGSRSLLDRDFVLVIDQLQSDSLVTLSPDMNQRKNYALIASFRPVVRQTTKSPMALKILVDCSGSMQGDSIHATKNALHEVLSAFEEDDKFSLSRFGTTVEHRSRALWSAQERTITSAAEWVDHLHANMGGTNMEEALESTFRLTSDESQPCDVLLITDGAIYAVDKTLKMARASKHRVFIVAIGSSPEGNFLTQLSQATGGACEFVASSERAASAITRMFSRIRAPEIRNLSVIWPEPIKPVWVSNIETSIFSGDTTHLYAWLSKEEIAQARGKELRLIGNVGKCSEQRELACVRLEINDQEDLPDTNFGVSRFVATQRFAQSCDKAEQENLALDYQLVTKRTSIIMINERSETDKATEMPALHVVRQMMPAGHSGFGAVELLACRQPVDSSSLDVPSVTSRAISGKSAKHMQYSMEIPSFLRRANDRDNENDQLPSTTRSKEEDVDDRVYWVKELETGERHYAFILEDPKRRAYTVWFFTNKRDTRTGVDHGVLFDYKDFHSHEAAEQHLVTNDFRKIAGPTPSDMPKPPTRLKRRAVDLISFLDSFEGSDQR